LALAHPTSLTTLSDLLRREADHHRGTALSEQ
jgi:hypothetical protein